MILSLSRRLVTVLLAFLGYSGEKSADHCLLSSPFQGPLKSKAAKSSHWKASAGLAVRLGTGGSQDRLCSCLGAMPHFTTFGSNSHFGMAFPCLQWLLSHHEWLLWWALGRLSLSVLVMLTATWGAWQNQPVTASLLDCCLVYCLEVLSCLRWQGLVSRGKVPLGFGWNQGCPVLSPEKSEQTANVINTWWIMPIGGLTPDSPMLWMGRTHDVLWVLAMLANEEFTLLILALGLVKDRSLEIR